MGSLRKLLNLSDSDINYSDTPKIIGFLKTFRPIIAKTTKPK
jgi:hypothetical protein